MDGTYVVAGRRRGGSFHIDNEDVCGRDVQFMTPCYDGRNDTNPEPLDLSKLCLEDDLFGNRSNSDDSGSTAPGGQSCSSEEEIEVRGRSRSRSVHENDVNVECHLPQDIVDNQGSTVLGAYGADIIEYDIDSDRHQLPGRSYSTCRHHQIQNMAAKNNNMESKGERKGPLQHREVLALKKGLEEANQSLNKNRDHEDEEERMAADAEKRKRILLHGRSLSADATVARRMKILMLGDSGVGKSSLILRWTMDTFSPSLVSTVGVNFKTRKVTVRGETTQVQVWDTAGQENFHKITTSYYRGANGIMLVYDVSDQKSFDNVNYWIKNIKSHASSTVQVVLIGNKSDLRGSDEVADGTCVELARGRELAATFGISFFETSAKESHNVDDAFMKLADDIAQIMAPAFMTHPHATMVSSSGNQAIPRGSVSTNTTSQKHSLDQQITDEPVNKKNKAGKGGKLFGFGKNKRNKEYCKSPLPASGPSESRGKSNDKIRQKGDSDNEDDDDQAEKEKCIIS